MSAQPPLSFGTRLSYASADTAGQLIFCVISFYLLKFYTDVYGISAATAGTILLVARFVDAIDAPIWGMLFDRTRSRYGKSRPWFLWLCGPFAVFGVLTFLTPDLGPTGKVIYAAVTYIACSVLYTGINTPVTSILSALTPDPRERVALTCYRMFGSKFGVLFVNLTALTLVTWLGGGDDRRGFMLVMPIYAVGSVALYLIAFRNLKERVVEAAPTGSFLSGFGALRGNTPWFIIFFSSLAFWIAFISRICTAPYYFEYALHRKDLIPFANALDFVSLAVVFFLPALCRRFSKRNVWLYGLVGMLLGQLLMGLGARMDSPLPMVLVGWTIGFIASGAAMAMPFSLLSDSVDYGEWKTGIRAAGLLTAIGAAFCLKAGSGFGAALPAWTMDYFGYAPNVMQTNRSLLGIELGFVWLPALFLALSIIPVMFYKAYESLEPRIHAELEARRGAAPTACKQPQ